MSRGALELIVLGAVYSLALLATMIGQMSAATKKAKESAPAVVAAKPTKQQSEQGQNSSIQRAKKSSTLNGRSVGSIWIETSTTASHDSRLF